MDNKFQIIEWKLTMINKKKKERKRNQLETYPTISVDR